MQIQSFRLKDWFNSLFSIKNRVDQVIGLDIGHSAIRMVLLDVTPQGFQLNRYTSQFLPKDAMVDQSISDDEAVTEAIRKAWTKLATPATKVVFSMPNNMVLSRKIVLTESQIDDVESVVESEVSGFVPFPIEEVSWDFFDLGEVGSQGEHEFIMCAAKKEKVEERTAIIELAGLEPVIATVDHFGLLAAMSQIEEYDPDKITAVFDLGTHKTSCTVLRKNAQIYYREQDFGGIQMNRELQKRFGLSHDDAEVGKRDRVLPEGFESMIEIPFMHGWVAEIDRMIQFFASTLSIEQELRPDLIILLGGGARLPNIDDSLMQKTGIHTIIANPFRNMQQVSSIRLRDLVYDAPCFVLACGLAMRSQA
jgi:type IV pilus assembly protein PilM